MDLDQQEEIIKIKEIKHSFLDYPDPEKSCITIYTLGCNLGCEGCHNKDLWEDEGIKGVDIYEIIKEIDELSKKWRTDCIAIMGGEPLMQEDIKSLIELLKIRKYKIILYTGYELEKVKKKGVKGVDYIKTGKYENDKKQDSGKTDKCFYLASTNQKIYDKNLKKISVNGVYYFRRKQ